ncbi:hypothetical protein MMPV_002229 [Pyropia vietnamensis]
MGDVAAPTLAAVARLATPAATGAAPVQGASVGRGGAIAVVLRQPPEVTAVLRVALVGLLATPRLLAEAAVAAAATAAATAATSTSTVPVAVAAATAASAAATAVATSLAMSKRRMRRAADAFRQTPSSSRTKTPSPWSDEALPPTRPCRLCSGGGGVRCDVCSGNGNLPRGGVHPRNSLRLASLVGSQWTSVEAIGGKWRHFRCYGKRVVEGVVEGGGASGQVLDGELPVVARRGGDSADADAPDDTEAAATAATAAAAATSAGRRAGGRPPKRRTTTLAALTSTCGPEEARLRIEVPVARLRSRRHWQSGWTTLVDIRQGDVAAPCFRCKGRGRVECPRCDGLGTVGL